MKRFLLLMALILVSFLTVSCDNNDPIEKENNYYEYQEGEEFPIGEFSTNVYNYQAFGTLIPNMERSQRVDFGLGDRLFLRTFSEASGLGPRFNARACSNCHFRDGRGKPLATSTDIEGTTSKGFLMRLSVEGQAKDGGPKPVENYGGQLQDRGLKAIGGKGEAKVRLSYEIIKGKYPDGTPYELRKPNYELYDELFGSLAGVLTSPRVGPQTIGFGFVDALTEQQLLANADEDDLDKDGISGKANYVWNVRAGKHTIGKFGWKANAPTLEQQIAGALSGDMGMTTSIFPKQNCPPSQEDCVDFVKENNLENKIDFPDEKLRQITFYQATLAVPTRRNVKDKDVLKGKGLFHDMKCIKCHAVGFKVKKSDIVPQIKGTIFNPYSDFLLHDMGDDLADNRPDYLATGKEWRTQPLWGIGMIQTVNKHTFLLHDGRARSIEEAILWHGGEAENSKKEFMNLSKKERQQVLKFIESL